jgi:DNA-3-methyladenine glycosylase
VTRQLRSRASVARRRADALASSFFARPAETVARELLGVHIVSAIDGVHTIGRIVETEAYIGPHDDASHAAARIGRTARNESMFGAPGIAYIYRIYGIHWCLNVVTDATDFPAAVLIRAVEPIRGIVHMRQRREAGQKHLPDTSLCSGPGRLAGALGITGALNAHQLDRSPLWLRAATPPEPRSIAMGARIGITRAADLPLRFWERDSRWVSR